MKRRYWVHYSSLDFDAFVFVCTEGKDWSFEDSNNRGPFKKAIEARRHGQALALNDIGAYRDMGQECRRGRIRKTEEM